MGSGNKDIVNNKKALEIFFKLIANNGMLKNESDNIEYFLNFQDEGVKDFLNIIEEKSKVKIFKLRNTLYLYAEKESPLSMTENDFKVPGITKNIQVYLVYSIFLVFLSKMFGGDTELKIIRNSININDLVEAINEYLLKVEDLNSDEELRINFTGICKEWNSLLGDCSDDKKKSVVSKEGFCRKAMGIFCKDELGLVKKDSETENYYATEKLKDFISHGELNLDEFNKLCELKEKGEII